MRRNKQIICFWVLGILLAMNTMTPAAPLGTAFTYQGRLTDGGNPASGSYDLVFRLYPASSGGSPLGTQTKNGTAVSEGYFTVELDFGSSVFSGEARWLEIDVAVANSGSPTTLEPRQEITPVPYALYAASSEADSDWIIAGNNMFSNVSGNVGIGIGSPFAPLHVYKPTTSTSDAALRVSTAETAGQLTFSYNLLFNQCSIDSNYSPIGTTPALRLNPSSTGDVLLGGGGGNVGIGTTNPSEKLDVNGNININSVYKIGGETVLSVPSTENTLVGVGAGANNTGIEATFVGHNAGYNNQDFGNTFIGYFAGYSNTTGYWNTFVGKDAGYSNTFGYINTFSGSQAGYSNTTGHHNTFLGHAAGYFNTTGRYNTFLGMDSGLINTEGYENTFVGMGAGRYNATGNSNTGVGYRAGYLNSTGSHNVFLGYQAGYNETGSEKLYIANGANDNDVLIYGDFSTDRIGIGTTSPQAKLEVSGGETILEQEPWQNPTFQNGWSNYGVGYNPAGYFKDSTGVVHLRGLVSGGTILNYIFTLPAGYRPEYIEMHTAMTNPNVAARVDINPNGGVVAQTGNNFFISLDGITFRAAN